MGCQAEIEGIVCPGSLWLPLHAQNCLQNANVRILTGLSSRAEEIVLAGCGSRVYKSATRGNWKSPV